MPTIRELVNEAEENYGTGRHGNSGPLFKRAGLQAFNHNAVPDALYLLYRALLDFEKTGDSISRLQLIHTISTELTKQLRDDAGKLVKKADDLSQDELITVLKLQLRALDQLEEDEAYETVLSSLIQEYRTLYTKTSSVTYLEEALHLKYTGKLMQDYLEAAMAESQQKIEGDGFDTELVALVILLRACSNLPEQYHKDCRTQPSSELEQSLGRLQQKISELLEMEALADRDLVSHQMDRYNVAFLEFLL